MNSPVDLSKLDADDLADALLGLAKRARSFAEQGKVVELAALYGEVRQATDAASGPALALLEVAESFLRAMARTDMGTAEMALRRFALSQADGGADVLEPLAAGGSITAADLVKFGDHASTLVDVGVLRRLADERFDLRPSLRVLTRDLIEPIAFRTWRRVNDARARIALGGLHGELGPAYLSAELAVTPQEARVFLRRHPLIAPELQGATSAIPAIAVRRGNAGRRRHSDVRSGDDESAWTPLTKTLDSEPAVTSIAAAAE